MAEDNPYEDMTEKEAEHMKRLMKGVSALITVSGIFLLAREGSAVETHSGDQLDMMIGQLASQPEKAHEVVMTLLSIIGHLRMGNTLEEWFANTGADLVPLETLRRGRLV